MVWRWGSVGCWVWGEGKGESEVEGGGENARRCELFQHFVWPYPTYRNPYFMPNPNPIPIPNPQHHHRNIDCSFVVGELMFLNPAIPGPAVYITGGVLLVPVMVDAPR